MAKPKSFPHTIRNRFGKVTVYRTRNGIYTSYKLVWKEGRHRKRESRPTEEDALQRAEEILSNLSEGAATFADATAAQWAYYRKCEAMLGGVPLVTAVEFYIDNEKTHRPEPMPVARLVELFIESRKSTNKSQRYLETVAHHLKRFEKAFRKPVTSVRVAELDAYLSAIPNPRTRVNHRRTLVTLLRWARNKGWLPRDQETVAERTDVPEHKASDPGVITPAQLGSLFKEAVEKAPGIVPYLAIAAFAGVRSAEIRRMTWETNVDLESGTLILGSDITKTRRRRVVHCEPALLEWLELFKRSGHILKVQDPHEVLRRLRGDAKWPHNALRHSAVSYAMALHRNASMVAEQCGHTESELQASYKAVVTSKAALEWFNTKPKQTWDRTQTSDLAASA